MRRLEEENSSCGMSGDFIRCSSQKTGNLSGIHSVLVDESCYPNPELEEAVQKAPNIPHLFQVGNSNSFKLEPGRYSSAHEDST